MSGALLEKKLYLAKESPEPIFDLSDCSLKCVPKGIFAVIKVYRKEFLYLQNNELSCLKNGGNLCDLSLLKVLDISRNKISKLPSDIKHLTNLKILKVDNNELSTLPTEIGNLSHLEQLSLSSNKLVVLPDSIGDLKRLQSLDIRKNFNLKSLPPFKKNKSLKELLLDKENEWKFPPKDVVLNGMDAILSHFCKDNENKESEDEETIQKVIKTDDMLLQLSLHDKYIQDNLRRTEKEKEKRILEKIVAEKNISEQKRKELLLHKQNQNKRKELLADVLSEQLRVDEKVQKFQKQKELEQNQFINQLMHVENTANEVIKRLLEINASQFEKQRVSLVSSILNDPPVKESLHCQQVLESMEKLFAQESLMNSKIEKYNLTKRDLLQDSNARGKEINDKIENLLKIRQNDQKRLLNDIKNDTDLQYAAVVMLIEKIDDQNVELRNEISLVESQLLNLTAMELKNKELHVNKHINELSEKRTALSEILMKLFVEQQTHRQQLIKELKEAEANREMENDNAYWLMQYQRLLNYIPSSVSRVYSLHPDLIYELTLFGVSHCAPFLSMFDTKSVSHLSQIDDKSLQKVGIHLKEDREGILKAIHHFKDQFSSSVIPSAPSLDDVKTSIPSDSNVLSDNFPSATTVSPSAPPMSDDCNFSSSTLMSECVICMDKQSNVILLTCGHICCCESCSAQVKICPMCRCDIERKLKIFTT